MTLALNCDRPGDGSVSPQRRWRGALKAANCSICANTKGSGDNMGQAEKRAIRQGWHAARPALWKNACARPWTSGAKGGKRSFYRTCRQGMPAEQNGTNAGKNGGRSASGRTGRDREEAEDWRGRETADRPANRRADQGRKTPSAVRRTFARSRSRS